MVHDGFVVANSDERSSLVRRQKAAPVVTIVSDPDTVEALRPEWDDLYRLADRPYLSQSFEWMWCAWKTLFQPAGARLHCIEIRQSGSLALVWPIAVIRRGGLRLAIPIMSSCDYNDVLVRDSSAANALARMAWLAAMGSPGVDLLTTGLVRVESRLHRAAESRPAGLSHIEAVLSVVPGGSSAFEAYLRKVPGSADRARRLRQLRAMGNVTFENIAGKQRGELIRWLIRTKQAALAERGITPIWQDDKRFEDFLLSTLDDVGTHGKLEVFALLLNGDPLAVQVSSRSAQRVMGMHIAFDRAWSRYSPGNLLAAHVIETAFRMGLPIDLSTGRERNKLEFANHEDTVEAMSVAASLRGRLYVLCYLTLRRLKRSRPGRMLVRAGRKVFR